MTHAAFFLPAAGGYRFCIHHPPRPGAEFCGAVLYLHPFAEEMNKSRRMAAIQARALAEIGFDVLQIDLLGCGDSSGDFGDARWEQWLEDANCALEWLSQRSTGPVWLWGLRVGALLANALASRLSEPPRLLLWNPVISGQQFVQQFLRLRLASQLGNVGEKATMAGMREALSRGEEIEVAGYRLAPPLAASLEQARLGEGGPLRAVRWLEISSRSESGLSPAADAALGQLAARCSDVKGVAVNGSAFWQTTEIEVSPALVQATIEAVRA